MRLRPSAHLRRLLLRALCTAQHRQHGVRLLARRQRAQLLRRHLAAQQAHHVAARVEEARRPAQRAVRQLTPSALLLLQRRRHVLHHARRRHHLLLLLLRALTGLAGLLGLLGLLALLHGGFDLVAHGDDLAVEVLAEEDARAEQQQTRVVGLQQAVRALQQQRGGALGGGVAAGKATA